MIRAHHRIIPLPHTLPIIWWQCSSFVWKHDSREPSENLPHTACVILKTVDRESMWSLFNKPLTTCMPCPYSACSEINKYFQELRYGIFLLFTNLTIIPILPIFSSLIPNFVLSKVAAWLKPSWNYSSHTQLVVFDDCTNSASEHCSEFAMIDGICKICTILNTVRLLSLMCVNLPHKAKFPDWRFVHCNRKGTRYCDILHTVFSNIVIRDGYCCVNYEETPVIGLLVGERISCKRGLKKVKINMFSGKNNKKYGNE